MRKITRFFCITFRLILALFMDMVQEEPSVEMKSESMDERGRTLKKNKRALLKSSISSQETSYYSTQVMQYDPNALTQTGPGMPKWIPFKTFNFGWSGPVNCDQMVSFTLARPGPQWFWISL